MRLLMSGLTLFVALCLLAPATDARAPKPAMFTAASVEFRNEPGDRITSDALGAYVDGGQRGLEVRLWINGSQDLTIGTFSSGRTVHFSYTPAIDVVQPTTNPPAGLLADNSFVNIRNIAAMTVGSTKITRALFNTAVGHFRFLGGPNPSTDLTTDDSYGSQAVLVARTSTSTWNVSTPVPAQPGHWAGSPDQVDYTAGDLNVLLRDGRRNTLTPIGLYHMPFGLTVTCLPDNSGNNPCD